MATLQTLIDDVRASTDHDFDSQVSDAQITRWINVELAAVRRILGDVAPTLFSDTETFTISSGNTWTITPTDFEKVRKLERLTGDGTYDALEQADPLRPEECDGYAFLERGNTLEVYPSTQAVGSYRLTYITKPATLTHPGDVGVTIDLPVGADVVVVERVSARVRRRDGMDPSFHLSAEERALREVKAALTKRYGAHRRGLASE